MLVTGAPEKVPSIFTHILQYSYSLTVLAGVARVCLIKRYDATVYSFQPRGGTLKNFWGGGAAPVFYRIPLAKEISVENIPLAKETFLMLSPFLRDVRDFQHKYSLF